MMRYINKNGIDVATGEPFVSDRPRWASSAIFETDNNIFPFPFPATRWEDIERDSKYPREERYIRVIECPLCGQYVTCSPIPPYTTTIPFRFSHQDFSEVAHMTTGTRSIEEFLMYYGSEIVRRVHSSESR